LRAHTYTDRTLSPSLLAALLPRRYTLGVVPIGLTLTLTTIGVLCGTLFFSTWPHLLIGPDLQQLVAMLIYTLGVLLLGPSPLLPFLTPSHSLFCGALLMIGIGMGIGMPMQMVLLLRILWREKGYTKQDVSGSLAAANLTIGMLGGAILPPLGAYLYEQSDAATLSTSAATFVLAGYLPIAFIIWWRYHERPVCFARAKRTSPPSSPSLIPSIVAWPPSKGP